MDAHAWGEVAKIAGGAIASLIVSVIGIQLQSGAKHRRVRRDLVAELELLRALQDRDSPELVQKVEVRVGALEIEYRWQLALPPQPMMQGALRYVIVPAALGGLIIFMARVLELGLPWWVVTVIGVAIGLSSVGLEWARQVERRQDAFRSASE
jgi:hypothetical protein